MSDQELFLAGVTICCSGGFGGFICSIVSPRSYKLKLPFCGAELELGFIADFLIGISAAIAIYFVASPLFNIKVDTISSVNDYLKLCSLGIISGFSGKTLINTMTSKLLKELSEVKEQVNIEIRDVKAKVNALETIDKAAELVRQGDFLLHVDPGQAMACYDRALGVDSQSVDAPIGKAKALRRLKKLDDAITLLNGFIKENPKVERAFYNRACYKNLAGYPKQEVLSDLREAIALFPLYKQYAINDSDFKDIHDDFEFKQIVTS